MALKRVCDITGTDRDVEICDVTIAGQAIKLDLSPAGAEKLREFFGPVVTVRHPLAAAEEPAEAETAEPAEEIEEARTAAEPAAEAAAETAPAAPAERPSRRGRRASGGAKTAPKNVKAGRKRAASRRAAKPVTPGTPEIREWARANGFEIGERGAIPSRIRAAYTLAHE